MKKKLLLEIGKNLSKILPLTNFQIVNNELLINLDPKNVKTSLFVLKNHSLFQCKVSFIFVTIFFLNMNV